MIRMIVAANVERLRDQVFHAERNPTARNKALAKEAGMAVSQVQRIIAQGLGTSIDYIEGLAKALHVRPQDLLTPYFSDQPYDFQGREPASQIVHDRTRPVAGVLQRR